MADAYNVSLLMSQMPRVQKFAADYQSNIQNLQSYLSDSVVRKLEEERWQVRPTEPTGSVQVKSDRESGREQGQGSRQRREEQESEENEQEDKGDTGNFIDINV